MTLTKKSEVPSIPDCPNSLSIDYGAIHPLKNLQGCQINLIKMV